jgi:hypothetical protein
MASRAEGNEVSWFMDEMGMGATPEEVVQLLAGEVKLDAAEAALLILIVHG